MKNRMFKIPMFIITLAIYLNLNFSCAESREKTEWPAKTERILNSLGENRSKFETILVNYKNLDDSLKFKAACFLLENISIHSSHDRIWFDSTQKKVQFNELKYATFKKSLAAFDSLKQTGIKFNNKAIFYNDVDTISCEYLTNSIDKAFDVWKYPWNEKLSFNDFCEYILPYRISTEPTQDWREVYKNQNNWVLGCLVDSGLNYEVCELLNDSIGKSFYNSFINGKRQEVLPLLGPLNLQHRKRGDCADLVNYTTYCLRSMGVPCVVDFVPYWGTSSGRHYWNVTLDENGKPNYFMGGSSNPGNYRITKEMPKVYRITYKLQPQSIGAKVNPEEIPNKILQRPNLLDVTSKYLPVKNIQLNLGAKCSNQAIFLCVHNNLSWKPVCGEIADSTGNVTFTDMGRGIVYLPMRFVKGKLLPASDLMSLDHNGDINKLNPVLKEQQQVVMHEKDGYLIYRPEKRYKFFYWDSGWKLVMEKNYKSGGKLTFSNIPTNTAYLMIPEYTWGKERIFTIESGVKKWW